LAVLLAFSRCALAVAQIVCVCLTVNCEVRVRANGISPENRMLCSQPARCVPLATRPRARASTAWRRAATARLPSLGAHRLARVRVVILCAFPRLASNPLILSLAGAATACLGRPSVPGCCGRDACALIPHTRCVLPLVFRCGTLESSRASLLSRCAIVLRVGHSRRIGPQAPLASGTGSGEAAALCAPKAVQRVCASL
jgi:hypothetical protein